MPTTSRYSTRSTGPAPEYEWVAPAPLEWRHSRNINSSDSDSDSESSDYQPPSDAVRADGDREMYQTRSKGTVPNLPWVAPVPQEWRHQRNDKSDSESEGEVQNESHMDVSQVAAHVPTRDQLMRRALHICKYLGFLLLEQERLRRQSFPYWGSCV